MRKNLLLPLLFFFIAFSAQAQLAAGNVMLGGGAQFSTRKITNVQGDFVTGKDTWYGLSPQIGYFLSNRVAAGLALSYTGSSGHNQNGPTLLKTKNDRYSLGPFVRVYQMVSEKAGFFGHVSGSYSSGRRMEWREANGWQTRESSTSFGAYFQPGFTYFIHERVGAEFTFGSAGYQKTRSEDLINNQKGSSKGYTVNVGLGSFGVGFNYFINR